MSRFFQDLSIMIRANLWLVPVLAALVAALFYFVAPPPPMSATMSTGFAGGSYQGFALRLKEELAREHFDLKLVESSGSRQNAERLLDKKSGINIALLQSGQEQALDPADRARLHSLGAVFQEPLWVFMRDEVQADTLHDLMQLRIAIGSTPGGLRMLVDPLLQVNGIDPGQPAANWLAYSGRKALTGLLSGELDAAFFMGAAESELIQELASQPGLQLMHFSRVRAYESRLPFVHGVEVSRGLLSLPNDRPVRDLQTLSAQALLVINDDFHPAIAPLILAAAQKVMADGSLLEDAGHWPRADLQAFEMINEADYFHRKGPPLLQRYLPFRIASLADRYIILVIPLLVVLFPLFKIAGPVYRWRIRARIYRWYKYLRDVDKKFGKHTQPEQLDDEIRQLEALQNELAKVEVPLSYTHELYELHLHVRFVIRRLQELQTQQDAPSAPITG
ncbi:MAG: C4-dicarboxylate ABC transporter substrate-binding protein [Gammaproteobacteria bacterium]|nr:C4-dicarboxylate ABC transporter substrate-binding protein [Gammaproteobacteria bacterium]